METFNLTELANYLREYPLGTITTFIALSVLICISSALLLTNDPHRTQITLTWLSSTMTVVALSGIILTEAHIGIVKKFIDEIPGNTTLQITQKEGGDIIISYPLATTTTRDGTPVLTRRTLQLTQTEGQAAGLLHGKKPEITVNKYTWLACWLTIALATYGYSKLTRRQADLTAPEKNRSANAT
jgi:hypothetical protein